MPRKTKIPSVRLEVLEQRILLAADLPISTAPQTASQSAESAPELISTSSQTEAESAQWAPLPVVEPLQITSPSGSVLDLAGPPAGQTLELTSGFTLHGAGRWDGPLLNTGVVAPGESPGILAVQAFEQGAGGQLKLEIGGLTPGPGSSNVLEGHDQITVSGQARLAGTLSLDFINDFRPTAGQVFDVMTWSSRQGVFSSYTGLYAGNGICGLAGWQPGGDHPYCSGRWRPMVCSGA